MNLTKAKELYCPIFHGRGYVRRDHCWADNCPMWRWNRKYKTVNVSTRADGQGAYNIDIDDGSLEDDGYCGLGGKEK